LPFVFCLLSCVLLGPAPCLRASVVNASSRCGCLALPLSFPQYPRVPPPPDRLPVLTKSIYGLGDMTINAALASLALVYTSYFLTQIAGLRPALAGLVPLVGRFIDAFTDPLMGRISDQTRWRAGRRRPYFLIAALPFGLSFAAMWIDVPTTSQAVRFAYYAAVFARRAARPQRTPQHDLSLATGCPHKHEISDVRARDQKQQPRCAEQQHERTARASDHELVHAPQVRFHVRVGLRVLLLEALHDHLELGTRLLKRHIVPQTGKGTHPVRSAKVHLRAIRRIPVNGIPEIDRRPRVGERRWHDRDNAHRPTVERHRTAHNARISTEALPPRTVTEDCDPRPPLPRIALLERSA